VLPAFGAMGGTLVRTRFFLATLFASLVAWLVVTPAAYSQESPQERARPILDATGVQGGLIVHVGGGDGRLTAALRAGAGFLVQGLDAEADHVRQARQYLDSLGVYGQVAVDRFDGNTLPYVDNLVNLLVIETPNAVSRGEIMRVLCPRGVAYIRDQGQRTRSTKPWPGEIDEWTHYLYDAGGNAASRDQVVGPPRHFQWIASPRDRQAALVLSGLGRVQRPGGHPDRRGSALDRAVRLGSGPRHHRGPRSEDGCGGPVPAPGPAIL
jgi:SAM-dependent methyltransferase